MNAVLEFQDSEVASVVAESTGLCLRFSAAHVRPTADVESGYAQAVELRLDDAAWTGNLRECVGRLSEGRLQVDGAALSPVPLPCAAAGQVRLSVRFANGSELEATASRVEVSQAGAPRYVESFAC